MFKLFGIERIRYTHKRGQASPAGLLCSILGLYWHNGKENGNYKCIIGYIHYSILSQIIIHCGTSHERAPLNLGLLVGLQDERQVLVRVLYTPPN